MFPSSVRSMSTAFGLDGNPGKVIIPPAMVTICFAPPKIVKTVIFRDKNRGYPYCLTRCKSNCFFFQSLF